MSAILTTAPASSMNATESGIRVFFIHMQWRLLSSNTNSMPALGASAARCIRPCMRLANVSASSARMRCMPALRSTTGSWACAAPDRHSANARAAIRVDINEKGRASGPAFVAKEACLLLLGLLGVFALLHLFLAVGLLRFGFLAVGLLGFGFLVGLLHFFLHFFLLFLRAFFGGHVLG